VLIPVLPGTNCEYDLANAFAKAGAEPQIIVVRNLSQALLAESFKQIDEKLAQAQILALAGDYFGGGEPEGSGKFTAAFFRHPRLIEALQQLLDERDGLILGCGSGFNALLKLGLLPYGQVREISSNSPALTLNTIGRHQSKLVRIRVASTLSPWLSLNQAGDIHTVAVSHGEGRFVCDGELFTQLAAAGQVASQYVDLLGRPTMDIAYNPFGAYMSVEALCSADGHIFGQISHPECWSEGNLQNVSGNKDYPIFAGAVHYFS
jgi:phosphoribosylformylglycinamidine synthase